MAVSRVADGNPPIIAIGSRDLTSSFTSTLRIAAFLAAHVPLALWMNSVAVVSTIHALATVLVGCWWALSGRSLERVAFTGAYIAGAEVLWRMTGARVFWEFGKYAVVALFLAGLLRQRRWRLHDQAILYFALLLPSVLLTLTDLDLSHARRQISFNLSGPLALMISVWFFSNLSLPVTDFRRFMLALVGPVLGIAAIAIAVTFQVSSIHFTQESNFATSGGFGPNQVGAILGLGAFLIAFYALHAGTNLSLKIVLITALFILGAQSAMTFSRGGLLNAAGATFLASLFLIRDTRVRARAIHAAPILFVIAAYTILPRLDAFTGGALSARFRDLQLTNRAELLQADLEIWWQNPLFGVGPGMAKSGRNLSIGPSAAHTEFSRLLAEHGVWGLMSLAILMMMLIQRFAQGQTPLGKAMVISMMGWSLIYMLHSAMRLAAPALLFGLAFAKLVPDQAPPAIGFAAAESNRRLNAGFD